MELQSRYAEFQKLGLGVASITYDAPALIRKFADERTIEFPLLSDADHTIVERYGILNRQYMPGERNYGIPHPGTFILDRDKRVVARYFEEEFQYRNTSASIALKIGRPASGMAAPVRRSAADLDAAVFLTDQTVAPGHRFSIVLDVTPKPGTHVVAPGQHPFRMVALRLEPNPNLRVYPMSYPPSSPVMLGGGTELLAAYSQPFRLVQDVAVLVSPEMRQLAQQPGSTFTLNGVLEYQTCTASSCSTPQQLPLTWTVRLIPLG